MARILHLSNTPLSRAPYNIASCQNHCGHEARVLLERDTMPNGLKLGGGEYWVSKGKKELANIFQHVEFIHFHNFAWEQTIFKAHPELREIAQTKKCLIQYHSDRYAKEQFEATLQDPFFDGRRAVLAQYHALQYPEADYLVGNPLPLFEDDYRPISRNNLVPLVSFAPSNLHIMKGYDYKGADQIIPVLRSAEMLNAISADVIHGVTFKECIQRKKHADVGIEELVSGSYHLSFLEYMALGCATIANISDEVKEVLYRYLGQEAVDALEDSYIQTTIPELRNKLTRAVFDKSFLQAMKDKSLEWISRYWSVEYHVRAFDRVYASLPSHR